MREEQRIKKEIEEKQKMIEMEELRKKKELEENRRREMEENMRREKLEEENRREELQKEKAETAASACSQLTASKTKEAEKAIGTESDHAQAVEEGEDFVDHAAAEGNNPGPEDVDAEDADLPVESLELPRH